SGFDVTMDRMQRAIETIEQDDRLTIVRTVSDIWEAHESGAFGMILGFQNSNPIEGGLHRLQRFYDLGLRSMQLTYNETNLAGSGCLAPVDEGLTSFGLDLVAAMN